MVKSPSNELNGLFFNDTFRTCMRKNFRLVVYFFSFGLCPFYTKIKIKNTNLIQLAKF